ncbi:hypothetical protein A1D29_01925 [Pasteurellaceae bacterium Orientalotternb1]|nr:hypothetical protein A1D29_01925 [Pasteurellaceae bacterium Orientalotternb1]
MLLAGFVSPMCIFLGRAKAREVLYAFFQELSDYLIRKKVPNHSLVTDRLYKRYVRFEDVEATFDIMKAAEDDFIDENPEDREQYRVFFQTFYDGVEEVRYLLEVGDETPNRFQTGLLELPYEVQEKNLPSAYYDDLPEDAEPVWMRTEALNLEEILQAYQSKS